jgi:hypothetical protein
MKYMLVKRGLLIIVAPDSSGTMETVLRGLTYAQAQSLKVKLNSHNLIHKNN